MLLIHEVMGRNCSLSAATAAKYRERLARQKFVGEFNLGKNLKDIDAVYIPELALDLTAEAARLKKVMDEKDCVTIFLSRGRAWPTSWPKCAPAAGGRRRTPSAM